MVTIKGPFVIEAGKKVPDVIAEAVKSPFSTLATASKPIKASTRTKKKIKTKKVKKNDFSGK